MIDIVTIGTDTVWVCYPMKDDCEIYHMHIKIIQMAG